MSARPTIPREINYQIIHELNPPRYRYQRQTLLNVAGNSVTLTSGSNQLLEFSFPLKTFNLSKSFITAEASMVAQGASDSSYLPADGCFLVDRVTFQLNGNNLCDHQHNAEYSKISLPRHTKLKDLLTAEPWRCLKRSNRPGIGNPLSYDVTYSADNMYDAPAGSHHLGLVDYTEALHLQQSGDNQALTVRYRITLAELAPDSILAMDKDVIFPDRGLLQLSLNNTSKIAYEADVADPTTTGASLTGDITLSNIYLWVAMEENDVISGELATRFHESRLFYNIPFVVAYRNTTSSTSINVQVNFTEAFGRNLQMIVHTVLPGTQTLGDMYNVNNYDGAKISYYRTYLSSNPLQDQDVYCYQQGSGTNTLSGTELLDWDVMSQFYKGSAIQNRGQFQAQAWCHIDSFVRPRFDQDQDISRENLISGRNMSKELGGGSIAWQFQGVAPNSNTLNHYTFLVFQRRAQMLPAAGFVWVDAD